VAFAEMPGIHPDIRDLCGLLPVGIVSGEDKDIAVIMLARGSGKLCIITGGGAYPA